MNHLLQLGWALRRRVIGALRLRTRGVKVMLFNREGKLLLIRNSYGPTHLFVLPGGGIGRRESPEAAAAREAVRKRIGAADRDPDGTLVVELPQSRAVFERTLGVVLKHASDQDKALAALRSHRPGDHRGARRHR